MAADSEKKRKIQPKKYLHPDLIREIFVRLPCKSLIRFKAACKLFGSLVQDPQFIQEHRDRHMKPSHYLIWDNIDKTKLHVFSLSNNKCSHVKTIETKIYRLARRSSYGLVCLHGRHSKSVALFNPTSGQIKALPDLPRPFACERKSISGAPVPSTWRNNHLGFGFDLKSQSYKVVQFTTHKIDRAVAECYVLTVNVDSSWRSINVSNESTPVYLPWQPIYVDGVLYYEMNPGVEDQYIEVLVFDLSTEKMNVIQSPAKYRFDKYGGGKHLTSLEGKLCCVDFTPPTFDKPLTMTVWKLNRVVDWSLWHKLEICSSASTDLPYWSLYPLYIDGDGRIICEGFGNLYSYNIHSRLLEVYPVTEKVEGVAYYPHTNKSLVHSETLLTSVNL